MLTKDQKINIRQFKLENGDDIIALVNEKNEDAYVLERPYKVSTGMIGGFYFQPWFPFSGQKLFKIPKDKITYHAELDEETKIQYIKLASDDMTPKPKPNLKTEDDLIQQMQEEFEQYDETEYIREEKTIH